MMWRDALDAQSISLIAISIINKGWSSAVRRIDGIRLQYRPPHSIFTQTEATLRNICFEEANFIWFFFFYFLFNFLFFDAGGRVANNLLF